MKLSVFFRLLALGICISVVWAPIAHTEEQKVVVNSIGMKLMSISAGEFMMGDNDWQNNKPHLVRITKPFFMQSTLVTQSQYRAIMGTNPSSFKGDDESKLPVDSISWNDAQEFIKKLNALPEEISSKRTYRLPTEAEWEYCCRAGTTTKFWYGNNKDMTKMNFNDSKVENPRPTEVEKYPANPWGLYDMHGNLYQCCEDYYNEDFPASASKDDPLNKNGDSRVLRGGSYGDVTQRRCQAAYRGKDHWGAGLKRSYFSFRVVTTIDDATPIILKARDPKINKEFEYLVFHLGNGIELKLVRVLAKGKTFAIGSSMDEQEVVAKKYFDGRRPDWIDFENSATVALTDDYFIGQFEVTRGQFRRFVEDTGYKTDGEKTEGGYGWNDELKKFEGRDKKYSWMNTGDPRQSEAHPVTNVSRNDARKFCEWLAKNASGKIQLREVRLPGEAEWEFACRAGSTGRFCFGDDDEKLAEYANVADATWNERFPNPKAIKAHDSHIFAAPVGQYKPNDFGIYDMHGNVWEWCEDFYGKYAALPKERNQIQTSNQGQLRAVMRGGACYTTPGETRCAFRWLVGAGASHYGNGGFRVVCIP